MADSTTPTTDNDKVRVQSPTGQLFDLPRSELSTAQQRGFKVYTPTDPKASLWSRIWTPLASSDTVRSMMEPKVREPGTGKRAYMSDVAEQRGLALTAQGYPRLGKLVSTTSAFESSTEKGVSDLLSSSTSPGSLALMALSGGESAVAKAYPEAKVLLTALRIPQRMAAAGFGLNGLVQMATPQQPGESLPDAIERRLFGASAFTGGLAATGASLRDSFATLLRRQFGLNDQLAAKVASQAKQIAQTKGEMSATSAKVSSVLDGGIKQIAGETEDALTRVDKQLDQQLADSKTKLSELDQRRVKTGAGLVATGMQALLEEQAKARQPFVEIGEKIKEPVSDAAAIRSMVTKAVEEKGVKPEEIPSAAFRALGKPEEGIGVRALTNTEAKAALMAKDMLTKGEGPEATRSAMSNLGFVPKQVDAIMASLGGMPETASTVSFDQLTRVREDLYDAADNAKDGAVRAGLMSAYQQATDMQERAAEQAGLGDKYKAAKANYMRFRRGIGSGLVQDWLSARDVQEQAILPKIAKLFNPSTAEGLRTALKAAGVDVGPLDAIVDEMKGQKVRARELPGEAREQQRDISREGRERATELRSALREHIRDVGREAKGRLTTLESRGQIVPGRTTSELMGMTNEQLLRERLRAQATRMEGSGMRNPSSFVMVVYGLIRLASGSEFGLFPLAYGATRGELPSVVADPKFQDWVFKRSGVTTPAAQANVRRGLLALRPVLEKAVRSGVQESVTAQAAQNASGR